MADSPKREIHHVFDLVFKRLFQEASPRAVVALVNGLFDTDFPLDSPVSFPNREKVTETSRQAIPDMIIDIAADRFLIDAQIDNDLNMALRMFQYGYYEAISNPGKDAAGNLVLTFPPMRVLYWETTKKTPDKETMTINFPGGKPYKFGVPTFKVLEHGIKELEGKKLALLLPFYTLKHRKRVKAARGGEERAALIPEVGEIMRRLRETVQGLREQGQRIPQGGEKRSNFPGLIFREGSMGGGKIESVMGYFSGIAGPRSGVNRLYPLEEVIAVTILAVMSFARGWEDIERYGKTREKRLSKYLKLENGIPRHDVFRRVFCTLKSEAVEECYGLKSE